MSNRINILFFCLLFHSLAYCQSAGINFRILNKFNNDPVPFAFFCLNNYCTQVNDSGEIYIKQSFLVKEKASLIRISCLGFQSLDTALSFPENEKRITLFVAPDFNELPALEVQADPAKSILLKAIDNLDKNHPDASLSTKGYYFQVHEENGLNAFMTEALAEIQFQRKKETLLKSRIRFRIWAHRKTNSNEKNKEQHGDHFSDLILCNPVYNPEKTILDRLALNTYRLKLDSIVADKAFISFITNDYGQEFISKGNLVIAMNDYGILRISQEEKPNPHAVPERKYNAGKYLWKKKQQTAIHDFVFSNEHYIPVSSSLQYKHDLINTQTGNIDFTVTELFYYKSGKLPSLKPENEFRYYSNLYSFNPGNWSLSDDELNQLYYLRKFWVEKWETQHPHKAVWQ